MLFIAYLVFFCWLITRVKFIANSGISKRILISLFVIKVLAGTIYGYIYRYIPNHQVYADTWRFFYESKTETDLLFQNPGEYFINIFHNPYEKGYQHFFSGHASYWSDLKSNFMVKLVSLLNILSFKHYYINVILFSFISFLGPIALYRLFLKVFPGKEVWLIIGCFLFPSFLYWCSGIHKDGLIFTGIALIMFHLDKITSEEGYSFKRGFYIFLCFLLIFPLRNYVALALIPPIAAWLLTQKIPQKKWLVFSLVYIICGVLFFTSRFIHPKINLPLSVSIRQDEFLKLKGSSFIKTNKLLPGFKSFVKNLPQAINHSLLRPYPTEIKSVFYLLASVEVIFYCLILLWFAARGNYKVFSQPSVLFSLFFSFSLLLLIGYTIPFIGAIVRYRGILLPLFITPLLCNIKKINSGINIL
ncbi:MAG TPA: hypothetical protein VFN30_14040 [Chitinophagaceae bacterium]|nr:hypothetical protein [Chitinophagaceae bacterium]